MITTRSATASQTAVVATRWPQWGSRSSRTRSWWRWRSRASLLSNGANRHPLTTRWANGGSTTSPSSSSSTWIRHGVRLCSRYRFPRTASIANVCS